MARVLKGSEHPVYIC